MIWAFGLAQMLVLGLVGWGTSSLKDIDQSVRIVTFTQAGHAEKWNAFITAGPRFTLDHYILASKADRAEMQDWVREFFEANVPPAVVRMRLDAIEGGFQLLEKENAIVLRRLTELEQRIKAINPD